MYYLASSLKMKHLSKEVVVLGTSVIYLRHIQQHLDYLQTVSFRPKIAFMLLCNHYCAFPYISGSCTEK